MRKVLLSIKPPFAEAILNGTKEVEFRRAIWKFHYQEGSCIDYHDWHDQMIEGVVVYASSPAQMIVGEFAISDILYDYDLDNLIRPFEIKAGASKEYIAKYLEGCKKAYAIEVCKPIRYPQPHALSELGISRPPQNFQYLTPKQLNTVKQWT